MARLSLASLLLGLGLARTGLAGLQDDRRVLMDLKHKISSDPQGIMKSWEGEISEKWQGLKLRKDPEGNLAIASLDFNNYHFAGANLRVEGFLDRLPTLALFHINDNHFKGGVPDLSKLKWLYELDLSSNDLSGPFPHTVLEPDLVFLDLRFNKFHGKVPVQLWTRYSQIEAIFINNNDFEGQLPTDMGASPVNYLSIANNKFSGPLPQQIGQMRGLIEFVAPNNHFTGNIPNTFGAAAGMKVFDVSGNQLTGPVPESLCALPHLEVLDVSHNKLSGSLGPNCKRLLAKGVLRIDGNKIHQ